jgi:cyclic-di-GMP-binding protein
MRREQQMPSFDVVSEVDKHTLTNAVDQANRVVSNRFDFKGVDAKFERKDFQITLIAEADFQVAQMLDMLKSALHKNGVDIKCLQVGDVSASGKQVKQEITVRTGLDTELSKKIVKLIKDSKLKVQAQIQSDQVRVTGKKRDDLQEVIQLLKESSIDMPLQFSNFRD